MNDKRYKWILYTIVAVIIATIGIQVYWNYKNYQTNKQQLVNEVQISLDKAVDDYYAQLAERTTFGVFLEGDQQKDPFGEDSEIREFLTQIDTVTNEFTSLDSLSAKSIEGITVVRGFKVDSMLQAHDKKHPSVSPEAFKLKLDSIKSHNDNFDVKDYELLTSKIVISISNDSLDLTKIDSLLKNEFERKNINLKSKLTYYESEINLGLSKKTDSLFKDIVEPFDKYTLSTTSKSTFYQMEVHLKLILQMRHKQF